MNDDYSLRDAGMADIPELARLLDMLFSLETDFQPDRARQEAGLTALIASGGTVICAESEGRIVGMATMQILVSTAEGGRVGQVEDVIVDGPWQGRNVGTRLLKAIRERAEEMGLLRLQLLADKNNSHARIFYRRRGWRPTALEAWRVVLV